MIVLIVGARLERLLSTLPVGSIMSPISPTKERKTANKDQTPNDAEGSDEGNIRVGSARKCATEQSRLMWTRVLG